MPKIADLPRRVQAIEAKLADANQRVAKAQAAIKADEVARRKHESAIQGHNQHISKFREQSLGVKTNDQYRALMNEISFTEEEIRKLEDKILETMIDADAKQQDLKKAQQELKEDAAEIEKEKAHARAKMAEAEAQLAQHMARQQKLRSAVDEDIAAGVYDRLKRARGTALAEALEQRCTACQVMLRPQVFNEVRMDIGTVYCDSCSRILYYNPAHAPEVAAVVDARLPHGKTCMVLRATGRPGTLSSPDQLQKRVQPAHLRRPERALARTPQRKGQELPGGVCHPAARGAQPVRPRSPVG